MPAKNNKAQDKQEPPEANRDDCYVGVKSNSVKLNPVKSNPEEIAFNLRKTIPDQKIKQSDLSISTSEELAFLYLCKLIPWANKFAPLVALDKDIIDAYRTNTLQKVSHLSYGLILETTGTDKLHNGELSLLQKISRALIKRRINHRLAISSSAGASWACSRFSNKLFNLISRDELQEKLSGLPVRALRLSEDNLDLLKKLGICQIGQLLEFQSKALASRFGMSIVERIEQALAIRIEPLICARHKETFKTQRMFDIPVCAHLTLQTVIIELLSELLTELKEKKKVAGSFDVELYPFVRHEIVRPVTKQFSLYQASNNKNHILSVVQPWISTIKANDGIKRIIIEAKFTKNEQMQQDNFYSNEKIFSPLPELLNQLVIRLGKNHVVKFFFQESYIPEKSFGYNSVTEPAVKYPVIPKTSDRPSYVFDPPQQIAALALLPDKPPASILWRGEKLTVTKGTGPERISPEWWLKVPGSCSESETRDYFKLQDQYGRWLWVFRSLPEMRWFIHGVWN